MTDRGADYVNRKTAEAVKSLNERRANHRRPRHKPQPNIDVQNAGRLLTKHAATVTEAVEHLKGELDCIGYPSKGGERVSGTGRDDGDGLKATELVEQLKWLRDTKDRIKRDTFDLVHRASRITGKVPNVKDEPRCRDSLHGREGSIDWGDPLCVSFPDHRGLCAKHYNAEARWRERNGLPSRAEAAA